MGATAPMVLKPHSIFHNPPLETSRQQALDQWLVVKIRPSQMLGYTAGIAEHIVLFSTYRRTTKKKAFDSFIWLNGSLRSLVTLKRDFSHDAANNYSFSLKNN